MKKNIVGLKFGRLTVLKETGILKERRMLVECVCDCGEKTIKNSKLLLNGSTKSCGCYSVECSIKRATKHGLCRHKKELFAFRNMINRCYNEKTKGFDYYGGRGINVCEPWRNSFENFFKDMGLSPSKNHSLDRINPNGSYSKENCRWVTPDIQAKNKRPTKNKTGFSGVSFTKSKNKPFSACIRINRKTKNLGSFKQPEDAYQAYLKAKQEIELTKV